MITDIVRLPIAAVSDVVTMGGAVTDTDAKTPTVLGNIVEDLGDLLDLNKI